MVTLNFKRTGNRDLHVPGGQERTGNSRGSTFMGLWSALKVACFFCRVALVGTALERPCKATLE